MKNDTIDRLLSRTEVEERFGITKRFLELAVMREDGPRRVKVGRLVRYRARDIMNWIEANATPEASK
jgi:predicted DNA-binding transcriptional regulator AlpA